MVQKGGPSEILGQQSKANGGWRKVTSAELDERVSTWISNQRAHKLPVSRKAIQLQAKLIASELHVPNFSASNGWLQKFMSRRGFSLRRATTACQKPPAEIENRIAEFILYVESMRLLYNYPNSHIYGADEVGVWLDGLTHSTVEVKGSKEVGIRSSGQEHLRITVLLTGRADGHKLPPFVLIPRKRPIAELQQFRGQLSIIYTGSGGSWMDDDKCAQYLRNCIGRDVFGAPKLLVWDAFRAHHSEATRALSHTLRIDFAIIPGIL